MTPSEIQILRIVARMMVPPSDTYDVPGADDPIIFADIVASLGPDTETVRQALATLGTDFATLDEPHREAIAAKFTEDSSPLAATLSRVILQCYYRDDRVIRSLGLEPRAPFPKGHTLEQGDWSLLDPVRARPRMWRA